MKFKAIVFDIGQTLAYYPFPLNWSGLYRPAFENLTEKLGISISEDEYAHAESVLTKYNTRVNPRQTEVSSDTVFEEILSGIGIPFSLKVDIKREFYSFFRTEARIYPEAENTLAELKRRGILTATLSDVAYGMDNAYALEDISDLLKYIDLPYTSNDIGFRKPSGEGLIRIAREFNVLPCELAFVGDEKKDIICAHNAGSKGILIDRDAENKDFGQDRTIRELSELLEPTI